jgi:hypothetical protein
VGHSQRLVDECCRSSVGLCIVSNVQNNCGSSSYNRQQNSLIRAHVVLPIRKIRTMDDFMQVQRSLFNIVELIGDCPKDSIVRLRIRDSAQQHDQRLLGLDIEFVINSDLSNHPWFGWKALAFRISKSIEHSWHRSVPALTSHRGQYERKDVAHSVTVQGTQKLCSSSVVRSKKQSGTSRNSGSMSWCATIFSSIGLVTCSLDHESFWLIDLELSEPYATSR